MSEMFDASKHVPVLSDELPVAEPDQLRDRPDIAPPHAFQKGAVVTHRRDKRRAVVASVDLVTRQMRLWYPDRKHLPLPDQYDSRTEWQPIDGPWEPELTLSPEEVGRQKAIEDFQTEMATLSPQETELFGALCDDSDPHNALRKLRALKNTILVSKKGGK